MSNDYYNKPRVTTDAPLSRARIARGLTQQQLADASDVSTTTISDIEHGKAAPTMRTLRKLASALGCELTDLL